jgi:hypothetical protein
LVQNDRVLAAIGHPSPLRVRLVTLQRTPRVLIAVQTGRSMRLYRRGFEPKLHLAAYVAELVAEVALASGAEVTLALRGQQGEWQQVDLSPASAGSGDLVEAIVGAAQTPPGEQQDLQALDVIAGTAVVYISDWLEEALDEAVFDWMEMVVAEGGQIASVGICSTAELSRAAWGWTPRTVCDRTAWTADDLRIAYEDHFEETRMRVQQASGAFALLSTSMEEQEVVSEIENAELLLRLLQA